MKSRNHTKVMAAMLIASMTLTACGGGDPMSKMSKSELIEAYKQLESEKDDAVIELADLKMMMSGIQSEDVPSATVSAVGDGTGRITFNSYDSQIVFPSTFEYPNSSEVASSSSINVTSSVSLVASTNWTCKLSGSSITLEHSSGISGTIKIGKIIDPYDRDALKDEVLAPWFSELPPSTVIYNDIFIGDNMWGKQATASTLIDEQDAMLKCGMVGLGEVSMVYVFVYRGLEDNNKEEIILNLLNSIKFLGMDLRVDNQ